jgi:hypothetical protein
VAAAGDTCASLAAASGVLLPLLRYLNPGVDCSALTQGRQLCLLNLQGCSTPYIVKANDTCPSIARDNAMSVAVMQRLVKGLNCSSLIAGQVLCLVPGGYGPVRLYSITDRLVCLCYKECLPYNIGSACIHVNVSGCILPWRATHGPVSYAILTGLVQELACQVT